MFKINHPFLGREEEGLGNKKDECVNSYAQALILYNLVLDNNLFAKYLTGNIF